MFDRHSRPVQQEPLESIWGHLLRQVPAINKGGAAIPPHGCVAYKKASAAEIDSDNDALEFGARVPVGKPDRTTVASGLPQMIFFNDAVEVDSDKPTHLFWNQPCVALVKTSYSAGKVVGPVYNEYYLDDTAGTHVVLGMLTDVDPVSSKPRAWVAPVGVEIGIFKSPSGGIAAKNTGTGEFAYATCDRYRIETTVSDAKKYTLLQESGVTVTDRVYNDMSKAIGGNHFIKCARVSGIWLPFTEDC